jgi:outer membrane protein assembly factor BamA
MMRMVLITVALAACHGGHVKKPGDERLENIEFEGNHTLSRKTLVAGLALNRAQSRGRALDPYLVSVDAERIRGDYVRSGFLDVDVHSRVERNGDAATVVYTIEEGPRAQTRIVIDGLPSDVPDHEVRAKLELRDGDPFDYAKYDAAKEPLLALVKDAGYAHARLDASVFADRANHTAVIELRYDAGPRCTFGAVEISGVSGDLADSVARRVAFARGDRYSNKAVSQTQLALYGMQRFSAVRVEPDLTTTDDVVPVKIAVSEGSQHEVQLGGGFGVDPSVYEIRGRAGYSVVGWPWPLTTSTIDLRPAYARVRDTGEYEPRIRALAKLSRIDLFVTDLTGEAEAGYNYLTVEAYTSYGPVARLGISTPVITPRIKLRVGWQLAYYNFRDISPVLDPVTIMELDLDSPERIGGFTQTLVLDGRDNPIDTRLGAYGEVRAVEGTPAAGGAQTYFQITPEGRGFVPIGPVVIAGKFRFGGIFGDVPPTERYYGGGSAGQRGFGERQLSPFVSGELNGSFVQIPIGGAGLIDTSLETRFPIATVREMPLGGVIFLDGGDVTNTVSELDPLNLNWAIGAGLRLKTAVGPARFDFGWRLNRTGPGNPEEGSHYAFHLSLGEAF